MRHVTWIVVLLSAALQATGADAPLKPGPPQANSDAISQSLLEAFDRPLMNRRQAVRVALAGAALALSPRGARAQTPTGAQIFATPQEIATAQERLRQGDPWTTAAAAELRRQADIWVRRQIPDATIPFNNRNATFYGQAVSYLGTAYLLTQDGRYRDLAIAILLRVTRDFDVTSPYVTSNDSLDFCVGIIPFAQAFDELRGAMNPDDAEQVRTKFLIPGGEAVMKNPYRGSDRRLMSNHNTWQNAGIGLIGFVTGRDDMVGRAIDDPDVGFKRQIEIAFGKDGLQWEGSPKYHFYTLSPFMMLAEAAERAGRESLWRYQSPSGNRLEAMLRGAIQIAETNMRLPNVGSRTQQTLQDYGSLYEVANKRFPNSPAGYGWVLSHTSRTPPDRPWTYVLDAARVWGDPPPADAAPPLLNEMMHSNMGWVTDRAGAGPALGGDEPLTVFFQFGRYDGLGSGLQGSAHNEAGALSLELRSQGLQLAAHRDADAAVHLVDYDRQTIAANTGTVDHRSQPGATADDDSNGFPSQLEFRFESPMIKITQANAPLGYKIQTYRRTVAVIGDPNASPGGPAYVIDTFEFADTKPHTYDYPLRAGDPSLTFLESRQERYTAADLGASTDGYGLLANPRSRTAEGDSVVGWAQTTGRSVAGLRIHLVGDGTPTQEIRAQAPGLTADTSFAQIVFRRTNVLATAYVAVWEPFEREPRLRVRQTVDKPDLRALRIEGPDSTDYFVWAKKEPGIYTAGAADDAERISINGRFGFVRVSKDNIIVEGDVAEFTVRAPGNAHQLVIVNRRPVAPDRVNRQGDKVRVRVPPRASDPRKKRHGLLQTTHTSRAA